MITITVKKNYSKVAAPKMRLILNAIKKKNALEAIDVLNYMNKGGAIEISKLIKSGVAAAKLKDAQENQLFIASAKADQGKALKRRWFKARGQSTRYKKGSSHLTVTLSEIDEPKLDTKLKNNPTSQKRNRHGK